MVIIISYFLVFFPVPVAVPTNIWGEGYNSTALEVHWDPVPDTREGIKGKLGGYQVRLCFQTLIYLDAKIYTCIPDFCFGISMITKGKGNKRTILSSNHRQLWCTTMHLRIKHNMYYDIDQSRRGWKWWRMVNYMLNVCMHTVEDLYVRVKLFVNETCRLIRLRT